MNTFALIISGVALLFGWFIGYYSGLTDRLKLIEENINLSIELKSAIDEHQKTINKVLADNNKFLNDYL